jgi:GntR family transcriptional regulator
MQFQIDTASRTPVYRQLGEQIRSAIARGKLKPQERLPSVRELSRQLVVNPNTIARVYTELEREGVLNTRPGRGVFVAQPNGDLNDQARRERLRTAMDALLTEAVHLGFTAEQVLALLTSRMERFDWVHFCAEKP